MNVRIRVMTIMSLVFSFAMTSSNGQSATRIITPDRFQGFTIGTSLVDFSKKNLKVSKNSPLKLFSAIATTSMSLSTLKDQMTEGGDKIDIDLFFYNDSLAVIRVEYKDRQSNKELFEALRGKYGDETRREDNIYIDPITRASVIMRNLYWEKWDCCIINLTSTDEIGFVYLTFAKKAAQVKIKNEEAANRQKRIN